MKTSSLLVAPAVRRSVALGIFLLILLLAVATQAQTYMYGRADFPVGTGPASIAGGDFNGDGTIDLAVVNAVDNTVSILLGRPDGTFAPQITYPTGLWPLAIVTGDFNGDGNLDLAVTNADCVQNKYVICDGHTVGILLGNGDGSFRPHVDYTTGTYPASVAAADFSGDGKLDLAIVNVGDGTVSVLIGNGDGTFRTQVVYSTGPNPQAVIVADFNNDHKLDLAVGGNGVSILLGNGDGTFQNHLDFQGSSPLVAADFNRDGKLDLFAGGDILLGNGDGTFVLNATYPNGTAAAAADLNGDGKSDLVIAGGAGNNSSSNSVAVLLGNGDGTFQPAAQYGTALYPPYVVIADFNGDGKFDLAVADPDCNLFYSFPFTCPTPGIVSILLGFGDGTFVGGKDYPFQSANPASQVIAADFNGDGKPDLVAETSFPPGVGPTPVGVYFGKGDGTFQPEVATSLSQSVGPVAAGDFNGDGLADLATVFLNCVNNTCLPGDAVVLIGNGDGTFQPAAQYTVGLQPENLTIGDFNRDGKLDLAVSNYGASTVSILLGNGDGTFKAHVDNAVGAYPGAIVTGDFNGDGKLDLVTVSSGTGVSVLLGNGDGTFQKYSVITVTAGTGTYSLATGDFNGDGRLDLAVTSQTSGQVFVLLGNGDGTFQPPVAYADGLDFGLPSIGDFNGDGKLDLIVGGAYSTIAAILLGNGDGTFQPPIFNFLSDGPIAVADFNQDGSPDLAAGTGYGLPSNYLSVMVSIAFKAVSPASLNFGSEGVGTTSTPRTITISNPSNVSFNIYSIVASGNFSQNNNCGASLAPGARCTVMVSFTPTATGLESGSITVTDNTRISPLAIPLSGIGVNGPFLTPFPSRVNFAPQVVGTSSTPAAILLVNTGNASLNLNGISLTGANSSDFAQANNCGSSLPVAGSCTTNVTFTPTAAGSRTASVAVSDTAPGSPQSIGLGGTGLGPIATLSQNSLTFASQKVGTTSAPQVVTLTNTGSSPLNITSIAPSGDFGETNTCNTSLAAGGNCQISATFAPTAVGMRSGGVTITDNATDSPQTIALSGTATAATDFAVGPAPGSSSSATITAGQTASFNLAVTPAGSFSGTVSLSCAITPAVSSAPLCSVPASVNVTQGTAAMVTVKVSTSVAGTAGSISGADLTPGATAIQWTIILLASGLLCVGYRRRKPALAIPMIAVVFFGMAACGGGSSTTTRGTPAGTYTATVSAKSGNLSHTTPLTVILQ